MKIFTAFTSALCVVMMTVFAALFAMGLRPNFTVQRTECRKVLWHEFCHTEKKELINY